MIPSDHFVRFYNEVFKFLDKRNGLRDYYDTISTHQQRELLEKFRSGGVKAMADYWDHIRIEENCGMELYHTEDSFTLVMTKCPSLTKVMDNDAGVCEKYCQHCPGWVLPLFTASGFYCVYNVIGLLTPRCEIKVFTDREKAEECKADLLASNVPAECIFDNLFT